MERYEYWVVKAPTKSRKYEGRSKADDVFAHTLMDSMNELAREGWQFVRTEVMIEQQRSFWRGRAELSHDYMVYKRALRSNGMSLDVQVAPKRVRSADEPNIAQLRDRITRVMGDPEKVVAQAG